jgi:TM2 domain-containing membrane protein YozV
MSTPTHPPTVSRRPDLVAALLSYLIPGLGQIYQGRTGKGLLFLVGLYGMFFYGMFLGRWSNVFLADTADRNPAWNLPRWATNLYNRPHFAGQFWIGVVAWPAIWHYNHDPASQPRGRVEGPLDSIRRFGFKPGIAAFMDKFEAAPTEDELNEMQRDDDKHWDLGWVYTVIAGVLNVLVIYDALAGPALGMTVAKPNDAKAAA